MLKKKKRERETFWIRDIPILRTKKIKVAEFSGNFKISIRFYGHLERNFSWWHGAILTKIIVSVIINVRPLFALICSTSVVKLSHYLKCFAGSRCYISICHKLAGRNVWTQLWNEKQMSLLWKCNQTSFEVPGRSIFANQEILNLKKQMLIRFWSKHLFHRKPWVTFLLWWHSKCLICLGNLFPKWHSEWLLPLPASWVLQ